MHKFVTTDNAFIDARLNYETVKNNNVVYMNTRLKANGAGGSKLIDTNLL